jgi:hypothetical protein
MLEHGNILLLVLVILDIVGLRPCGPLHASLVDAPGRLSVDLSPPEILRKIENMALL